MTVELTKEEQKEFEEIKQKLTDNPVFKK